MNKFATELLLEKLNNPLPPKSTTDLATLYYIEILSECNLRCPLCAFGSKEIFTREKGIMDFELFEQIVKKIHKESPSATICPYHHCEPTLHPDLPEMIQLIKGYGHSVAIASNFNKVNRLEDLIKAKPDVISVSVSGFNQSIYERHHVGGNIEVVKQNLIKAKELIDKHDINDIRIAVNYHMYKDNIEKDFDEMSSFCMQNGFSFEPSFARMINLELSLKYLRSITDERKTREKSDWLDMTMDANPLFYQQAKNIFCMPDDYLKGEWEKIRGDECPVNHKLINIKWDGRISRCSASFDDRNVTSINYLKSDLEELYRVKKTSPVCKECMDNNYAFYMNYVGADQFNSAVFENNSNGIYKNRGMFFSFDRVLDDIEEFVKNHKRIYIAGAGGYGQLLYNHLINRSIKIEGFCVTGIDRIKNNEVCIDNIKEDIKGDIGIVTAMNEKNLSEAYSMLENSGLDVFFISPVLYRCI